MIERIDHKDDAINLLLSQYSDSPLVQMLLESWLTPVQELEDSLIDFINNNGISNATGAMLDILGEWLGVPRKGRPDSEYRTAILGRSVLEGVDGTTEKFLDVMTTLCQSENVTFDEYYPATLYPLAGNGWNNSLITELQKLRPAGVHLRLLVDHSLDSFKFTEILGVDNSLITGDGEEYQVDVDGVKHTLITASSDSEILEERGDFLAELIDEEWTPPAEVVTRAAKVVDGYLVDDSGNYILDDQGNKITVRSLEA